MTVESEVIEIVRAHNLRHLSATVTEDGRVKVSVLERKPPRVKGFDPVKYYQGHRDAIRKYQADYYIRTGKKSHRRRAVPSQSYFPTPQDLASAMAYLYSQSGTVAKADDFSDASAGIMQFFGFEREVVGNHLEQDEIALMYQLEDIGLVSTRIEEYTLMDGTPWRVNYFILNSEKIREFSSKTVRTSQDNASLVYENLPAEAWAR